MMTTSISRVLMRQSSLVTCDHVMMRANGRHAATRVGEHDEADILGPHRQLVHRFASFPLSFCSRGGCFGTWRQAQPAMRSCNTSDMHDTLRWLPYMRSSGEAHSQLSKRARWCACELGLHGPA